MNIHHIRHNSQGFTFIEVAVSIMVLSLALLAMAGMQAIAIRSNAHANQLSQGSAIAEDIVESLMLLPYNHATFDDTTPEGTFTMYHDPNPPTGYRVQWEVDIDALGNKTINVNVTWQTALGSQAFSLSFLKRNA
jgi:prepilin-type N-terminal cleavage/methylation domain-containing protein